MVQITITASMNVVVQDPMPAEGAMSITVDAATTKSQIMTNGQFNRLAAQLVALETLGALTYVVTAIPDTDTRAQDADLSGLPTISRVSQDTIDHDGEQSIELQGMNIVAYQEIAQQLFADSTDPLDPNKQITILAAQAGIFGNLYDFQIVDTGGAGPIAITVTPVPSTGRSIVEVDLVGLASTYAEIATAINDPAAVCLGIIFATLPGTGGGTAELVSKTPLIGGTGMGMSLTLCDEPCVIRTIDLGAVPGTSPQKIIFDSPDLNGIAAAGEMANLVLRSGAKMAQMTFPVV